MSTPAQPGPLKHVEAVAEVVVQDAVQWVRGHPAYAQVVEQLGLQALHAVAAAAGVTI